MLFRVADPWVSTALEIRRVEVAGSKYLLASPPGFDEHLRNASAALRQGQPDKARSEIEAARNSDPSNPIFDYMRAMVSLRVRGFGRGRFRFDRYRPKANETYRFRRDRFSSISPDVTDADRATALRFINAGNAKGVLRFYATRERTGGGWVSPSTFGVTSLARAIARDPRGSRQMLVSSLGLIQKIMWSDPSSPSVLGDTAESRDATARRLLAISRTEGDARLASICNSLMEEDRQVRDAVSKAGRRSPGFDSDTRTYVLGTALRDRDENFSNAATLLGFDKQAEWAAQERREILKISINASSRTSSGRPTVAAEQEKGVGWK